MGMYSSILPTKSRIDEFIDEDFRLTQIIYTYIANAGLWLIFGTAVGLYLGVRLVWPDFGIAPILSFGRLRPVHTNVVFWGWSSLAMLGLAHYVVPRTSQAKLYSMRASWLCLALINLAVISGVSLLLSAVNNGDQEYREFIWPVMGTFDLALLITAFNFYQTIAHRQTKRIYIANWWIMAALFWTFVVVTVAYIPYYQYGIGETVIQGYYMHMGVGMWFTPMVLGLTYYFLPKLLNKPLYSYSLSVIAFWTQMLFYSMIGAHHFMWGPIPWWLQTVAIIFSVAMLIPVIAGTANFLLTMKGSEREVSRSYALPFILVGILYYFFASGQGTFEAFRFLSSVWHFTNFTIAHSHMTMYGFVAFLIWGGTYGLLPRITGKEPPHYLIGTHFWFATLGILIYGLSLMVGGTQTGELWWAGKPFIDSVKLMGQYWLWRAVAGTLMFSSHLIFFYNLWSMRPDQETVRRRERSMREVSESVGAVGGTL